MCHHHLQFHTIGGKVDAVVIEISSFAGSEIGLKDALLKFTTPNVCIIGAGGSRVRLSMLAHAAKLARLGVEYIDLYYQPRVDSPLPIEDTINHSSYAALYD
ncbi:unnamed protein product [Vicia faba]|uniref:Uncharacterized protein n=1 Tax=Vicia faba TaxID=3906 RepID=A0AAV1B7V1_VICFA|nr:unnamed protein product [Vicia faba]